MQHFQDRLIHWLWRRQEKRRLVSGSVLRLTSMHVPWPQREWLPSVV